MNEAEFKPKLLKLEISVNAASRADVDVILKLYGAAPESAKGRYIRLS